MKNKDTVSVDNRKHTHKQSICSSSAHMLWMVKKAVVEVQPAESSSNTTAPSTRPRPVPPNSSLQNLSSVVVRLLLLGEFLGS